MKSRIHRRFVYMGIGLCVSAIPFANGGVAFAATANTTTYSMTQKTIQLGGQTVTQPYGFTANGTAYMPIWYVMNTLQSLGIQSTWKNNVWNLTVPTTFAVDLTNLKVGTGVISLEINGTLTHQVNGIAAVDPSSGKETTFIPIWYTQQLLQRLGITSTWDGTTWGLTVGYPDGHPVTPPPTLPSNEVATWQLLAAVDKSFSITPDPKGPSPYDDIASTDPNWAVVHAAIEKGIYQATSSTESGAYTPLTVTEADTVLWNAYGMTTQTAPFQPGGTPTAWATIVGLNPPGVQPTDLLTPQEFSQLLSNLANNQTGYVANGSNSFQLMYPIEDEAAATFNGDSLNGQAFFNSSSAVQNAIDTTYQFYNSLQLHNVNGTWVLSMPSLAGTGFFSYTTTFGNVTYQLPGASSWQTGTTLDTSLLTLAPSDVIQVQVPDSGLTISLNEMLPSLAGTVALGELEVSMNQNVPVVQRIDVSQ